jgi:hypothetical protein
MPFSFIEDVDLRAKAEAAHKASTEAITASIDAKIAEATNGLKTKNEELLDEKKKIAETLKSFDGLDVKAAKEALKFLSENEEAQLIKDGKVDELIAKRTSSMKTEYDESLTAIQNSLKEAKETGSKYQTLFESKLISDNLREEALAAGVLPEAFSDVVMKGNLVFTLDKNLALESRTPDGKLKMTIDDRVMTPALWIESLRKSCPHYWPRSAGAGAFSGGSDSTEYQTALATAASSGDMATYRKLRAKNKK